METDHTHSSMSAMAMFQQLGRGWQDAGKVSYHEDYGSYQSSREQSFGRGPIPLLFKLVLVIFNGCALGAAYPVERDIVVGTPDILQFAYGAVVQRGHLQDYLLVSLKLRSRSGNVSFARAASAFGAAIVFGSR